jgi:hypothetical protein
MDSATPPILRLPAELLFEILSLAVPSLLPEGFEPRTYLTSLKRSPFHSVRSTCRTFRLIVDELPFWNDNTFDIGEIEKFHRHRSTDEALSVWPSAKTQVLLSDANLPRCLSRKTGWRIANPVLFDTISQKVPEFGQYLRYLNLNHGGAKDSWVHITNSLRDICPILTCLYVESTAHIHFDTLPDTLEVLEITEPYGFECHCKNNLPNLHCFDYQSPDALPTIETPIDLDRVLPFNSKNTLRDLGLALNLRSHPSISLICEFENITDLVLHGANVQVLRVLRQSPLRLRNFATTPASVLDLSETFLDFLKSPVMQDVEELDFGILRCDLNRTTEAQVKYESLIRGIAHLPALTALHLYFPLHIDWFRHFRESYCLESVRWEYFNLQSSDNEDTYKDVDLPKALRQILPYSGDDVHIDIECVPPPLVAQPEEDEDE